MRLKDEAEKRCGTENGVFPGLRRRGKKVVFFG